jgi:hopanoid biosynthesis associated RND transporter like protein HpnN
MSTPPEPLAVRVLRHLAAAILRYPRAFFYPHAVLFVLSLGYTVDKLQFNTNRNDLVGAEKQYHQNYLRFKQEFLSQDDLVAVVESEDLEKNRQFVERLGARLEGETNLFTDVFYKGDLKMMGPKALLFVTNDTILAEMLQRLKDSRPVLESFAQATNLNSMFRLVNQQFRAAGAQKTANTDALLQALPALTRIASQAADCLDRPGTPPSPGITALFDGSAEAEQNLYITFATNRIYLVTAKAAREELNAQAVERLRDLVRQTQAEVPGVNAGLTGEPVLEVDEMAQSQKDTTVATVVALVLCVLLFIYGYKETGRPIKATVCLVVGLAYTLGFTTLTIGHLNILTITFLPILVGLSIDFGIHLVTRYEEEVRRGRGERQALQLAIINTGQGIFTGCFTTAGAFLAMGLTGFRGIQEMGIICGCGLLLCLAPMITLLPVLLLRGRQNVLDHEFQPEVDRRARIERLWLERPGLVTSLVAAFLLFAALHVPQVFFDYNLLHMQSDGLSAVEYEKKLINSAGKSVLYGAVVTDSLQQAVALERRLLRLPSVASVDSMAQYLAEDQAAKLLHLRQIKAQLQGLDFPEVDDNPVDLAELRQTMQTLQAYLGLGSKAAEREGEAALSQELRDVRRAIVRLRQKLANPEAGVELASRKLAAFQQALFTDLQDTLTAIRDQDDSAPLRAEDLPAPLRHRFVSKSGTRYLLQVTPKFDVWERENQEIFIRELRAVDPKATGTPVQLYEYTKLLKDSYQEAALYSLAAIAILVFIHFRSVPCVLLALLPVAIGSVWLMGWMGWQGIPFNPANIMTLPLVVGVGVTNGIHILNRFAEEQNPGILARSTGKAVLFSALTTMAGFGSLIPAKHQGIASLGLVMTAGTATCMLAGLTFLPTLLNYLNRRGWLGRLAKLKFAYVK